MRYALWLSGARLLTVGGTGRSLFLCKRIRGISVSDYARPETLAQALQMMSGGGWRVLGGGTDLYPGAGSRLAGPVLDVSALPGFSGITQDDDLRIGAGTTWAEIAGADLPGALRALQQAALQVGGRQVQNAGTIGGNLCNASPAADGVPPLLALGAEVELVSADGTRLLPLEGFLLGPRRTALQAGEVLAAVIVRDSNLRGTSAFEKLGARSHLVISIAMVAARVVLTAGRVTKAMIAVGSCSPTAVRLPLVEAALVDAPVTEAVDRIRVADVQAALSPVDDVRATAEYRLEAAVELVRRAVAGALA
jgi:CO/xanthine dehydrogenase FAD-binding subunit